MKIKTLALALFLALAAPIYLGTTGCSSSAQVATYKTLAGVGEAADVTMTEAAKARHLGQISDAQWQEIKHVHDYDFIPAYNLAVDSAATSGSPAPSNVVALSARLASLLARYIRPSPSTQVEPKIGDEFICSDGVNVKTYEGNGIYRETLVFVPIKSYQLLKP